MKTKDEWMEARDGWESKAFHEDIKCARCGMRIPYGEQDVYHDTGMCGHCAHTGSKND